LFYPSLLIAFGDKMFCTVIPRIFRVNIPGT